MPNVAPTIGLDAYLDLLRISYSNVGAASSTQLFLGDGAGSFSELPAAYLQLNVVAPGDFNGDGHLDFAAGSNAGYNKLLIYYGDGTGLFTGELITGINHAPAAIAAADFNGDGKSDSVIGGSNLITVTLSGPNGPVSYTRTIEAGAGITGIATGDINGDGHMDIVTSNGATGHVSVLVNNGAGQFLETIVDTLSSQSRDVALGDVNGDGRIDIVSATSGSFVSVLLNNGDGTYNGSLQAVSGPSRALAVNNGVIASLTRENRLPSPTNDQMVLTVLRYQSGSYVSSVQDVGGTYHESLYDVSFGDFNKDGLQDIFAYNRALLNNGSGAYTPAGFVNYSAGGLAVAVGDFNPSGRRTNEDVALFFSGNNVIKVADADGGSTVQRVTLSVAHGVLQIATPGAVSVSGNGSGTVTLDGTIAALNSALASLSYTPELNYNGFDTLNLNINDNDVGGALTGSSSVRIGVSAVNDLPAGTDKTIAVDQGGRHVFTAADFGFSDPEGSTFHQVRFSSLPAQGKLWLNGAAVTAGQFAEIAQINSGQLTYTPAGYATGNGHAGFAFQVVDSTGAMDASPNTITVDVQPVAQASDLNADSKGDMVLRRGDTGEVSVRLLDGLNPPVSGVAGAPGAGWQVKALADLNGDRRNDVILQNTDGSVAVWQMDGVTLQSAAIIANPGPQWQLMGAGDFDGDSDADLLLRNENGAVAVWRMNGASFTQAVSVAAPPRSWHVAGVADFNGDGRDDIFLQSDFGQTSIWLMDNAGLASAIDTGRPGQGWRARAIGDLSGTGRTDIVFQRQDGTMQVWSLSGTTLSQSSTIANTGTGWNLLGMGDANADGKDDLFVQNAAGQLQTWFMSGTNIQVKQPMGADANARIANNAGFNGLWSTAPALMDANGDGTSDVAFQNTDGSVAVWTVANNGVVQAAGSGNPGATWKLKDQGDFNSDGKSDLLFQHDSGAVAVWTMDGATITSISVAGGAGARLKGAGDFDGDAKTDIVFQSDVGQVSIWRMNGTALASELLVNVNPGPDWQVRTATHINADGKSDLVLQNTNGAVAIWLMDGASIVNPVVIGSNPGASWQVVAAEDLSGDGLADLVLQNDNGQVKLWTMNGTATPVVTDIADPGPNWRVKSAGDFNADGFADLLLQNSDGQSAVWTLNAGSFSAASLLGSNPGSAWRALAAVN